MKFFALLATLTSGAIAHGGIDLMHEHNGGVFRGVPRPIGCNAPNLTAGEPEGTLVNLTSSIEAYVVTPKQRRKPNSAIIYLSDIFGLPLLNNRLLADNIADAGFQVVFPDLFDGDAVPVNAMGSSSFNMTAWRERHPVSAIDEIITATIRAVSEDYGFEGIGAVGYCFGGKYVARFLAEGKGLDAGFTAHPSGLTAEELSRVAYPISIAYAANDNLTPPTLRDLAEQTFNETGIAWQTSLYSGVGHGFAVRANISDPQALFAQESAYLQAVRFLDSWI